MSEQLHINSNDEIQQQLDAQMARKKLIASIIPYFGLVFITIFLFFATGGKLFNAANTQNLITQCFTVAIVAVGASFVYAHGGMDFSIGATCGSAQLVAGLLLTRTSTPFPVVILICILVPVVGAGMVAGISAGLGVPAFVGSICIRAIFYGILTTGVQTADIHLSLIKYDFMNSLSIKIVVLILVLAVGYFLFEFTRMGKYDKAIGGNPLTAQQAGINNRSIRVLSYLILGVCVGIAAVFQLFRTATVTAVSGQGLEFNIMLAVVLGGFPLTGGEASKLSSAIVGALTVTILSNGLALWGLDPSLVSGVKGVLFIIIVGLSYDRSDGKLVS